MPCEISLSRRPPKIANDVVHTGIELIRDALNKAGFHGLFSVCPLVQIRMRSHTKLRVKIWRDGQVLINIKTGNNATAWQWGVRPPQPLTAEHVYKLLKEQYPDGDDDEEEHVSTTKPRFNMDVAVKPVNGTAVPLVAPVPAPPPLTGDLLSNPYEMGDPDIGGLSQFVAQLSVAQVRAASYTKRDTVIKQLKEDVDSQETKLLLLQDTHDTAVAAANSEHAKKIKAANEEHQRKIKAADEEHAAKLKTLQVSLASQSDALKQTYETNAKELARLRNMHIDDNKGREAAQFVQALKALQTS